MPLSLKPSFTSYLRPTQGFLVLWVTILLPFIPLAQSQSIRLIKTIRGNISPKSIVHNGEGLFFAQNMIYHHSITVYNRNFECIKTISDRIKLSDFGHTDKTGYYLGGPVEGAFSPDGQYLWVSNYRMQGAGFARAAMDTCVMGAPCDPSYLYKINTSTLAIEAVVQVGCVPKFLATSADNRWVIVSNWCSGTVSLVDVASGKEYKQISVGPYPRGIAIDHQSRRAYISLMGSTRIAVLDLQNLKVSYFNGIGSAPRHLCIDPTDRYLYASLNGQNQVVKIDLSTGQVIARSKVGLLPRTMVLTQDGNYLYVTNYQSHSISKLRSSDLSQLIEFKTSSHPIGLTLDESSQTLWVASYTGALCIYKDSSLQSIQGPKPYQVNSTRPIPVEPDSIPSPVPERYAIVVGSYLQPGPAEKRVRELQTLGYPAQLLDMDDKYRVALMILPSKAEALTKLTSARKKVEVHAWICKIL